MTDTALQSCDVVVWDRTNDRGNAKFIAPQRLITMGWLFMHHLRNGILYTVVVGRYCKKIILKNSYKWEPVF
jgi:hypothetical protein